MFEFLTKFGIQSKEEFGARQWLEYKEEFRTQNAVGYIKGFLPLPQFLTEKGRDINLSTYCL